MGEFRTFAQFDAALDGASDLSPAQRAQLTAQVNQMKSAVRERAFEVAWNGKLAIDARVKEDEETLKEINDHLVDLEAKLRGGRISVADAAKSFAHLQTEGARIVSQDPDKPGSMVRHERHSQRLADLIEESVAHEDGLLLRFPAMAPPNFPRVQA